MRSTFTIPVREVVPRFTGLANMGIGDVELVNVDPYWSLLEMLGYVAMEEVEEVKMTDDAIGTFLSSLDFDVIDVTPKVYRLSLVNHVPMSLLSYNN
jgi:hypothetical protein